MHIQCSCSVHAWDQRAVFTPTFMTCSCHRCNFQAAASSALSKQYCNQRTHFLTDPMLSMAPAQMHLCNAHTYPDVPNSVILTVERFDALHVHTLMCPMMTVPSTQVCRRLLCRSLTPVCSCCVCPSCSICCGRLCCAFCRVHQDALSLKGSIHCTVKSYPLWC